VAPDNWDELLRPFAHQMGEREASFQRVPRRFPDLVGIVPGYSRRSGRPRVQPVRMSEVS
jgi:hypothetical protein